VSHLSYDFLSASHLSSFSSTLNTSYRKSVSFRSASMKFCIWDKDKSAGINEYPPCGNIIIMRNWHKSVYVEFENARWKSGHLRARLSKFLPKWLSFYRSKKRCLFFAINMHFSTRLNEWAQTAEQLYGNSPSPKIEINVWRLAFPTVHVRVCMIVVSCNDWRSPRCMYVWSCSAAMSTSDTQLWFHIFFSISTK
jgi:hypothetical protein